MRQLHGRLGFQLPTGSAIWTWALRHAAWLISRFSVLRGATPYELAFGNTQEASVNMVSCISQGDSNLFAQRNFQKDAQSDFRSCILGILVDLLERFLGQINLHRSVDASG